MYLVTCAEAAQRLGVSAQTVRRRVRSGAVPCLTIGGRVLIDLDVLRAEFDRDLRDEGEMITMEALSELTGLSLRDIRRGLAEGWLTCRRDPRDGRRKLFGRDQALSEIERRMRGEG